MKHDELFKKLKADLKIAAYEYSKLFDLTIIFKCDKFKNTKAYKARFYKQNFLHLTGAKTKLHTSDFFEKCLSGKIEITDICNFPQEYRSIMLSKIRNLKSIFYYFNHELQIQEDFKRNTVSCVIATSDGIKTIGFVNTKPYIRPMTIMNKNKLDNNENIYTLLPLIKIKKNKPRYSQSIDRKDKRKFNQLKKIKIPFSGAIVCTIRYYRHLKYNESKNRCK